MVLAAGLWRGGHRLPRIPEGDVVVLGETAMRVTLAWGEAIERAHGYLREGPTASLSLLTLVIILAAAMLAWGRAPSGVRRFKPSRRPHAAPCGDDLRGGP
jgi:hypothetical protein